MRTITFNEVFQDGKAKHKHAIIREKEGDRHWYILKCECAHHILHFGGHRGALRGAAQHLGNKHGLGCKHGVALEQLGWRVVDCNEALAKMNNRALEQALAKGYKPLNTLREARPPLNSDRPDNEPLTNEPSTNGPPANELPADDEADLTWRNEFRDVFHNRLITRPEVGGLYYVFWPADQKFFLAMVLGWDGSPDCGLPEAAGGLDSLGLLDGKKVQIPYCYDINWMERRIQGWAEGFQDGRHLEDDREFPVLFFDEK